MVTEEIKSLVLKHLDQIEKTHNVEILYACESGSRMWNFASEDSDYDVRFVYKHKPEWYVSLKKEKDTIEKMLPNDLDLSGWDLKKALGLFRKCNPSLIEWLRSDIVYRQKNEFVETLRSLIPKYYTDKASFFHYYHMAKGNFREYLQGDSVKTKKYLYVIRPLLACHWIDMHPVIPPAVDFFELLESCDLSPVIESEIRRLVEEKKAGMELDKGPRRPILNDFIVKMIDRFDQRVYGRTDTKPDTNELDQILQIELGIKNANT